MIQQLSRRVRRTLSRLKSQDIHKDILFLHVPKCGGTSLVNSIASCYTSAFDGNQGMVAHLDSPAALLAANLYGHDPLVLNRELLAYYLAGDFRYVYGHFTFSEMAHAQFKDKYAFITLIREPVSKWISLYFYNRYKDSDHYALDLDLDEFIETDEAAGYGCDYVMQFIGDDALTNYTSSAEIPHFCSPKAIERACANLDKFDLVGTLEQLDLFQREFSELYGAKLNTEHRRESPLPRELREKMITPEILEKITQLNRPNSIIYKYVVNKLVGHYTARRQ